MPDDTLLLCDMLADSKPYLSGGSKGHQSFVREAVRGRKHDAQVFLDVMADVLNKGREAGVDINYLIDTANRARDAAKDLLGKMRRDLDNAHLDPSSTALDFSEIESATARLLRKRGKA